MFLEISLRKERHVFVSYFVLVAGMLKWDCVLVHEVGAVFWIHKIGGSRQLALCVLLGWNFFFFSLIFFLIIWNFHIMRADHIHVPVPPRSSLAYSTPPSPHSPHPHPHPHTPKKRKREKRKKNPNSFYVAQILTEV